ncbi:MAG: hypothetical protein ACRDH2_01325 [Anaerolineales bacterium]
MTLLPADRFHPGVRLGALLVWFAAFGLVYFLSREILILFLGQVSGIGVLILLGLALFVSQPLARWGEHQLVKLWPSGRAVELEPGRLTLREKSGLVHLDVSPAIKVNYWRWRFEVRGRRGGHVPNGHHCFAIRLVQGEKVIGLYSFLSPQQAQTVLARYPFYELHRPSEKGAPRLPLGGRDAVYLAAENARWESGAELDPADFEALLDHLNAHLPEFASGTSS